MQKLAMAETEIGIEKLKERLKPLLADPDLLLVLLFGSHATGKTHSGSDIDLGFLYQKPFDLLELTNRVIQCLQTDQVDVVDLRRANPLLAFSAVRERKIVFERTPGQFNAFYSLAFRKYADTKKLREARRKTLDRFLKEKGLS